MKNTLLATIGIAAVFASFVVAGNDESASAQCYTTCHLVYRIQADAYQYQIQKAAARANGNDVFNGATNYMNTAYGSNLYARLAAERQVYLQQKAAAKAQYYVAPSANPYAYSPNTMHLQAAREADALRWQQIKAQARARQQMYNSGVYY